MKRWNEEQKYCKRQQKIVKCLGFKYNKPLGKYRKRKGLDCGNPQCHLCHCDKFPRRRLTRKEQISLQDFKEND